jgi:hypothetical protein
MGRQTRQILKAFLPHQYLQKVLALRAKLCLVMLPFLSFQAIQPTRFYTGSIGGNVRG